MDDSGAPESLDALIRELPDHLAELIVVVDEDGGILWFNLTAEAVLGWPRSSWVGRNIVDVLHPDDVNLAAELLVSARATGPGVKEPVVYRLASVNDGWIEIEAVAATVRLALGRAVLVCSARPTRRARRPEFIVGEVGERLSIAFDGAVIGMAKVGLDGRILHANARLAELAGVAAPTLHGTSLVGLLDIADRSAVADALAATDQGQSVEIAAGFGAGSEPVGLHLTVVPDWTGQPMYVFVQILPG